MESFLISRKVVVMVLVTAPALVAMVSPLASCAVSAETELSKTKPSSPMKPMLTKASSRSVVLSVGRVVP